MTSSTTGTLKDVHTAGASKRFADQGQVGRTARPAGRASSKASVGLTQASSAWMTTRLGWMVQWSNIPAQMVHLLSQEEMPAIVRLSIADSLRGPATQMYLGHPGRTENHSPDFPGLVQTVA